MLELKNVSFSVPAADGGEHRIIDNISLTLDSGKFTVITGPNGGGKSTIAKLIMGIEKPTAGRIFLDGEDITDLSIEERAKRGIGYAFQQPPRFKGLTVRRLLSLAHGSELPILVFLHFPPVWNGFVCREIVDTLHEYGIRSCYFGHIHGAYYMPRRQVFEDIEMILCAADAINFSPMPVYATDF